MSTAPLRPGLTLVSFPLCPYVQRGVIALEEKRAPYAVEHIDLSDKPAWFLELSPFGRVPLLLVDGAVLFESAAIAEYIDETTGEPRLHPADPLRRAHNRAWIEAASTLNATLHRLLLAATVDEGQSVLATVRELLRRVETQLGPGPYFNGERFSLVDAATAPALQRLSWCEQLAPGIAPFTELPAVARWRDALLARPSVQRSTVPDVRERFVRYLRGDRGRARPSEPASWLTLGATR